jgi:hypothetical protein
MTTNLGSIDRVFRIILGVILLAAPFMSGLAIFSSPIATGVAVIAGIIMLATSAMRFCPLYRALGMRTCKV